MRKIFGIFTVCAVCLPLFSCGGGVKLQEDGKRYVKSIRSDRDCYEFSYDDEHRLTSIRKTDPRKKDERWTYVYRGNEILVKGETTEQTIVFAEDGSWVKVIEYYDGKKAGEREYRFSPEGRLQNQLAATIISDAPFEWEDGNLVSLDDGDGHECTYTEIETPATNFDVARFVCGKWVAFPYGPQLCAYEGWGATRNLLETVSMGSGSWAARVQAGYELDEAGYIVRMKCAYSFFDACEDEDFELQEEVEYEIAYCD